jgi:hypothetical protein
MIRLGVGALVTTLWPLPADGELAEDRPEDLQQRRLRGQRQVAPDDHVPAPERLAGRVPAAGSAQHDHEAAGRGEYGEDQGRASHGRWAGLQRIELGGVKLFEPSGAIWVAPPGQRL